MPITAFLHTHVLVVVLFLILFTIKAVLLNKHKTLDKVRSKTKVLDMIFGTLILITGGYLVFQYSGGIPTWLIIKIVLVLLAIPLGIVGIKRENKVLAILTLLIFLYVYGVAETKSLTMQKPGREINATTPGSPGSPATDATEGHNPTLGQPEATQEEILSSMSESTLANAKAIYVEVCATCHGEDGARGVGGAADLTISKLSLNDRKNVISNGRGLMPGFASQLDEQEIEALAAYTLTFKK